MEVYLAVPHKVAGGAHQSEPIVELPLNGGQFRVVKSIRLAATGHRMLCVI